MDDRPLPSDPRDRARGLLPRALLALAAGCSIAGIGGFLVLALSGEAPHIGVLLVPPVAALAWITVWWTRTATASRPAMEDGR